MKRILLTIFLLSTALVAKAQSNYSSTLQASGGYVEDGWGVMASYDYYFEKDQFVQLSIGFDLCNDNESDYRVPYAILKVQPSYWIRVWEGQPVSMPMSLSLGGGGTFGYMDLNKGESELRGGALLTANGGFVYGVFLGMELEYHHSNDLSFLMRANQTYYIENDLGNLQPYAALGVKYYLF